MRILLATSVIIIPVTLGAVGRGVFNLIGVNKCPLWHGSIWTKLIVSARSGSWPSSRSARPVTSSAWALSVIRSRIISFPALLASLDGAIKSCCADKTAIRILVNDLPGRHCTR
jgi:hypothetical protein